MSRSDSPLTTWKVPECRGLPAPGLPVLTLTQFTFEASPLKLKHLWSVVSRAQTSLVSSLTGSDISQQVCLWLKHPWLAVYGSGISGQVCLWLRHLWSAVSSPSFQGLTGSKPVVWDMEEERYPLFLNSLIQYIQTTASSPSFLPSSSPQPPLSPRSTVTLIPFRKEQTSQGDIPTFNKYFKCPCFQFVTTLKGYL